MKPEALPETFDSLKMTRVFYSVVDTDWVMHPPSPQQPAWEKFVEHMNARETRVASVE